MGLVVFAAATLFRLQRPWRDTLDLVTDLISYAVGVAIAVVALGYVALALSVKRTVQRSSATGPTTYVVSDDGIEILKRSATVQLHWDSLAGFSETPTLVLLRFRQSRKMLIIPKRELSSSLQSELVGLLSTNLERLSA
jgi:membrane-associated PAP2 superfamily phosphatase